MARHSEGSTGNARTPEELETLFEDALMTANDVTLKDILEAGAVLVTDADIPTHGTEGIVRLALATWQGDHPYVANPRHVVQARDIALIVTDDGVNVARRRDGTWRYAIVYKAAQTRRSNQ